MNFLPQIMIVTSGNPRGRREIEDKLRLIEREPLWRFKYQLRWVAPVFADSLRGIPRRMAAIIDPLRLGGFEDLEIAVSRDHEIYYGWKDCDAFLEHITVGPAQPPMKWMKE